MGQGHPPDYRAPLGAALSKTHSLAVFFVEWGRKAHVKEVAKSPRFGRSVLRPALMIGLGALTLAIMGLCPAAFEARESASIDGRSVEVRAGENLREIVDAQSPGTTFVIEAGTYRSQSIHPKDGDSFIGEPGAVLSGAQVLGGFSRTGGYWAAPVQAVREGSYPGTCDETHPPASTPKIFSLTTRLWSAFKVLRQSAPVSGISIIRPIGCSLRMTRAVTEWK